MDQYRIGVSIVLANGVSPVLAVIGRDLLGLNAPINAITKNFKGWATALGAVGAIIVGEKLLGGMKSLVEETAKFQDQLIKIQGLGGQIGAMAATGQLTSRAFEMARTIPMKVEDLMKVPGDLNSILGPQHALEAWDSVSRYAWVARRNRGEDGGGEHDVRDLIRAGEMSGRIYGADGQIDPAKLNQFIDDVTKATAATHGMVNPQSILALAQQAGPALRGLDEHGFLAMLVQSQAMGGNRAGTAYLSLWQQLATGTMTQRTAEGLQKYGFLHDGEFDVARGGRVILSDDAKNRLTGMIGSDPMNFARAINEELQRRGITDPAQQMGAVMNMTGRQTTQRFTAEEVVGFRQMLAEIERLQQGLGVNGMMDLYKDKSITGNLEAMHNAFHNLVVAIGGPEGENFVKIISSITSALNGLTGMVRQLSPEQINGIFMGLIGVGSGLIVLGGLLSGALISTIIGGAATIGIVVTALGAAVATLVALNWSSVTSTFYGIVGAISNFLDQIAALYGRVQSMLIPHAPTDPANKAVNDALKNIAPMRFEPGRDSGRGGPVTLALNIDGRTMAQAMIDNIDGMTTFPSQAPTPDGTGRYFAGDHNSWDT
jgi:hypothetical protein